VIRLGLCCGFVKEPVRFRTSTAAAILHLPSDERESKLRSIIHANAAALLDALRFCADHGMG
jgi:UV DNA damage endonuclease